MGSGGRGDVVAQQEAQNARRKEERRLAKLKRQAILTKAVHSGKVPRVRALALYN